MVLNPNTLKAGLDAMVVTMDPNEAIQRIATAFADYFAENMAGPVGVTSDAGAKAAMVGAMANINTVNMGAVEMAKGITLFWTTVIGAAVAVWVAAPPATGASPPPVLGGLAVALQATFIANVSAELTLSGATQAIADTIHGLQSGGIVIFPPPISGGLGPQPII